MPFLIVATNDTLDTFLKHDRLRIQISPSHSRQLSREANNASQFPILTLTQIIFSDKTPP
jgi:hypothetical protein